jgi:hypothetical protein
LNGNADLLRAEMDRRRQRHSERMRSLGLKSFGQGSVGSPTQDAALKALRERGPLTQRQINEAMEIKFRHPRSLDLALCQLEKRAVVRRARDGHGNLRTGPHGAQLWEYADSAQAQPNVPCE